MKTIFRLLLAALFSLTASSYLIQGQIDSRFSPIQSLDKLARGLDFSNTKVSVNSG